MDKKERNKKATGIVFGVLLVTLGLIFTLHNLDVLEAGRLRRYWPLILIAMGLPSLIAPKDSGDPAWGVLMVALGSFFQLRRLDLIEWSFWDIWPLGLVLIGLTLLVQDFVERRRIRNADSPSLPNGGTS